MNIIKLKQLAIKDIENINTESALEQMRLKYLGRKQGELTAVLRGLKDMKPGERAKVGKGANVLKNQIIKLIDKKKSELKKAQVAQTSDKKLDITAPGKKTQIGHLHPITQVQRQIEDIFSSMGFSIIEGPEIEKEYYNFDALNIAKDHPARDMMDTFWLKNGLLLRTHTSPVQARYMEKNNPPLRIISPGRCFRHEALDASHEATFHQVEGLMVDKKISIANLKGIFLVFIRRLFSKDAKIRLRPGFFPFVEPGFELDMSCIICKGKGCSLCKQTGWLEIMPGGMVHPNVFKYAGYIPGKWQGFAFAIGLDRITLMKYKINDIRLFYQNDLRFLKQF